MRGDFLISLDGTLVTSAGNVTVVFLDELSGINAVEECSGLLQRAVLRLNNISVAEAKLHNEPNGVDDLMV